MALFECVPNVSEGRRASVIDHCAAAIRTAGVRLLDVSSDSSHNRSVFTFAGDEVAVEEAVLALFGVALASIDLRVHSGVHPRMGAVDVVPFVPLHGTSLDDCVALAVRVAAEVARRHALPVYLYEAAASSPARRSLENVRRGGFEGLAAKMAEPDWRPDYGPSEPHPTAGATAIGARNILIAYNIDLATTDIQAARSIAAAIRESSGGLRFVKAMGVDVPHRGRVQVSMNLTNYRVTPLVEVFERVQAEARSLGVAIAGSEIVGLAPAAALPPGTAERIKLQNAEEKILEERLE
jgi:glutamate formiminotransferase